MTRPLPSSLCRQGMRQLEVEQRSRRRSSPNPPTLHSQENSIPLSEIIRPLQNGGLGSIEDMLGKSPRARGGGGGRKREGGG